MSAWQIREMLAYLAVTILASGSGYLSWFVYRHVRNREYVAFRAGQLHGAQIAVDKIQAAIDNGVDIENLRRGLDTEELTIAEMVDKLDT